MKAMLSAYLDDELTRAERVSADAHVLACEACRSLVERAERLDGTLRSKVADDIADAAAGLASTPIDVARFQADVLAAIGHAQRRTWRPRLAAAAAVALAIGGGWWFWSAQEAPQSLAPTGPGTFVRGGDAMPPVFAMLPVDPPASLSVRLAALSEDDRQTLYATSLILDNTRRTAFVDEARRAELREMVRYDELVDRLGEVISKLPPEEQSTVALAREATARIAAAADDPRAWIELQQDVERRGLAPSIEMMSEAR
jgi:uncharacterized protein (UPF0335 family)